MSKERIMGWETSRLMDEEQSFSDRARLSKKQVFALLASGLIFFLLFLAGCWLASNPFESTQRIASEAIVRLGWQGSHEWGIIWWIVFLAVIFEFLDSSAGMGYGTAFTPFLLLTGFSPLQIVPVIMIQQCVAGFTSAYIHKELDNVEWRMKPVSESVRLWLIIAGTGCIAVVFSVTSVYGVFRIANTWIKLYVAFLLTGMGIFSLLNARRKNSYTPKKMIFFGALAGFNKGIGGGGYGPVVTIGGLLAGIPAKTMMAITALSEGTVCLVSIAAWLILMQNGVIIDFVLMPSMLLGSLVAVIAAPYATRVLPEKVWKFVVPAYCCILAAWSFWKAVPDILKYF